MSRQRVNKTFVGVHAPIDQFSKKRAGAVSLRGNTWSVSKKAGSICKTRPKGELRANKLGQAFSE